MLLFRIAFIIGPDSAVDPKSIPGIVSVRISSYGEPEDRTSVELARPPLDGSFVWATILSPGYRQHFGFQRSWQRCLIIRPAMFCGIVDLHEQHQQRLGRRL